MFWAFYSWPWFTVCTLTFKKGHTLLGIVGIFLPFLWLIGAIPPGQAPGSRFAAGVDRAAERSPGYAVAALQPGIGAQALAIHGPSPATVAAHQVVGRGRAP